MVHITSEHVQTTFSIEWFCMDNRKLETYSTYKIDFCLETYLTIDMYHKHII